MVPDAFTPRDAKTRKRQSPDRLRLNKVASSPSRGGAERQQAAQPHRQPRPGALFVEAMLQRPSDLAKQTIKQFRSVGLRVFHQDLRFERLDFRTLKEAVKEMTPASQQMAAIFLRQAVSFLRYVSRQQGETKRETVDKNS